MHPRHSSHTSAGTAIRGTHRRQHTPEQSHPLPPLHHFQTSLPSIRQLHPYLPPSGMSHQHLSPVLETPAYTYPPPSQYNLTQQGELSHQHIPPTPHEPDSYPAAGSEHEGDGDQPPPKKKRRRQALSFTGISLFSIYLLFTD